MIGKQARLKVADNSGAKELMCIQVIGGAKRNCAQLGDIIVASVKSATPRGQVKKKEVVKAVIVRQKFPYQRADGTTIRFDENDARVGMCWSGDPVRRCSCRLAERWWERRLGSVGLST